MEACAVCGATLPHPRIALRHALFLAIGFLLGHLIDVGADW